MSKAVKPGSSLFHAVRYRDLGGDTWLGRWEGDISDLFPVC